MNASKIANEPASCRALVQGAMVLPDEHENGSGGPLVIQNGALCIEQDRIIAIGDYTELRRRFNPEDFYGSENHLILPGFINAHDHVRAPSCRSLGVSDDRLEAWIIDLMRMPDLDPERVSALAHCQMLEAGVTTVVNSFYQPDATRYDENLRSVMKGARQAGARAVVAMSTMDQSIVSKLIGDILHHLPEDLRKQAETFLSSRKALAFQDYESLVRSWSAQTDFDRASVMMGPVSVHWCTDALLEQIWGLAQSLGLGLQTHLLESAFQRDAADARYGRSAVEYMHDAGLLLPKLSCAHGVFTTRQDWERLAEADVSIIHCPGSNMRLQNGVAPIGEMLKTGVNIGLGLDSMSYHDDGDMLREIRFAYDMHANHAADSSSIPKTTLLQMSAAGGARAIGMNESIGSLQIGKQADIVVYAPRPGQEYKRSAGPSIQNLFDDDPRYGVDLVFVGGELIVEKGRHKKIDSARLHADLVLEAEAKSRKNHTLVKFVRALNPFIQKHAGRNP
ncbi:amidohydrolase family protein [Hyphococcus sp.]|uniref:amidohydrolase family protein n=1 Tax=Hyphococcus sp. TaxID=2038636 RepID=UPI003CCB965F